MNPISHLQNISGVQVRVLDEKEIPIGRTDKQYEVTINPETYDYSQESVIYKQKFKKISIKDRYNLGLLIGFNKLKSLVLAVFSSFKSQDELTKHYIGKLKNIKLEDFYKKCWHFYHKIHVNKDDLLKKLRFAYYPNEIRVNKEDADESDACLFRKALGNLKAIKDESKTLQVTINKDRNVLQTVAGVPMRCNKYKLFQNVGSVKKQEVISELLLSIPDEPILKEAQKTQLKFLEILGFEAKI